jgi:hypothetical protein
MSPHQALEILEQVAAKYVGTRQDHALIDEALAKLGDLLTHGSGTVCSESARSGQPPLASETHGSGMPSSGSSPAPRP